MQNKKHSHTGVLMNHPILGKPAPFHTHITFTSGDRHKELTHPDKLESTITRLLRGPAAQMGIIKEVKIVEVATDCIVFLASADSPLRLPTVKFPVPPAQNSSQK